MTWMSYSLVFTPREAKERPYWADKQHGLRFREQRLNPLLREVSDLSPGNDCWTSPSRQTYD